MVHYGSIATIMETVEYQKMFELESSYWWFVGRQDIVSQQLRRLSLNANASLLNVGSGTGGTVAMLERFGRVTNVDVAEEAIAFSAQQGIAVQKIEVDQPLPFTDGAYDGVIALDVLEHIEHDQVSLADWYRVLRPGGIVILTVPAYPWLWSEHDEGLHHFRRYTLSELHRKFNYAGFVVRKRSYVITFSFLLIVLYRFVHSLRPSSREVMHHASDSYVRLPNWLNKIFILLLKLESRLLGVMNFPFGTSILMVGQKPKQ